ncbi:MAG: aminotransferase class IV, partial [Pyrinomonadaceae bacterium]|nr:aminotransferase class IV [Pyrinomonadaceae bacterium]
MHSRIIYNHRLLETAKARGTLLTAATLYGRGVFTTLAVYEHHPFLWHAHWWRLIEHAARVHVDVSGLDEERASASLVKLIEANEVKNGRARLTLLAGTERGVWEIKGETKTELLMMTGDARVMSAEGLAMTVSPYRLNTLSPLVGVKSVNYLEHIMAWE